MSSSLIACHLPSPPRTVLACAAACLCAAATAQSPAVVQSPAAQASGAQPQTAPTRDTPTIKRWVDERGVTHYGDTLPPQAVGDVKELPEAQQSSDGMARGQTDLARYRQQMQSPSAPSYTGNAGSAAPQRQPNGPLTCAQQWAQYNNAYACMNPYRLANGGVKPEAFQKCPTVTQPSCPSP